MAHPRLSLLALALAAALPLVAPARADRAEADAALAHTFTLQGLTAAQPLRAGGAGYDWDWRGPRDDPEWAWFFNRHHWFPDLLAAYRETGDARYRDALLATLDDWIATHPPPGRVTFSAAWRPLEAARRLLHSWLPIAPELARLPGFSPERAARFQTSLVAHGEHLMAHHAFGGNHLVTEMQALARLALVRPDLPGAERWLAYALEQLARAYDEQVYPDGAHVELSTHYQRVIALNYQELLDALRAHGRADLAVAWEPRVEKLWRYVAAVMTPAGGNPLNNDSDREDYRSLLAAAAPALLARPPATTHFPFAGQTVFRSGPGGALWGFLEAGPRGTDHDHADHLQFDLAVGEREFLVDNGRYTYQPGPWRDYFAGPTGHNVLLLDGRGADPRPRRVDVAAHGSAPLRFREQDGFELAWGDATFSTVTNARAGDWRRVVVHAPGVGWAVIDRVVAFGPVELTTQWHWAPEVLTSPRSDRFVATSGDTLLNVRGPAGGTWRTADGLKAPAPAGWFSPKFNQRLRALQTDYEQTLRGPRVNVWLFQPATIATPFTTEVISGDRVFLRAGDRGTVIDPAALPR